MARISSAAAVNAADWLATEAVLRYWQDFIPSWAGAISIDLLPVVLVLVLMIVHDAMRRDSASLEEAENITAAEMLRAMALYRQMEAAGIDVATGKPKAEPPPPIDLPEVAEAPPADDATVTPIDAAQRKRTDTTRPA